MYSSLEKLSSGLKINSAADGPAELVISEHLRSQIASLNQEIENTSALIGKYETASSTLGSVSSFLTEIRSLAVGAANGGFNSEDAQAAYATAANSVVGSFNKLVSNAEYNGVKLFDGSEDALALVNQLQGIDLSSPEAASASIEAIDNAASELSTVQVEIGATERYRLREHLASLQITSQNLQAAESTVRDTDYALEFSRYAAEQLRFQVGLAMMSHIRLNSRTVLGLLES